MTPTHQTIFTGPTQADIDRQIRAYVRELDEAMAFPQEPQQPKGLPGWAELEEDDPGLEDGHETLRRALRYFLDGNPPDFDVFRMAQGGGWRRADSNYRLIQTHTGFDPAQMGDWLSRLQEG